MHRHQYAQRALRAPSRAAAPRGRTLVKQGDHCNGGHASKARTRITRRSLLSFATSVLQEDVRIIWRASIPLQNGWGVERGSMSSGTRHQRLGAPAGCHAAEAVLWAQSDATIATRASAPFQAAILCVTGADTSYKNAKRQKQTSEYMKFIWNSREKLNTLGAGELRLGLLPPPPARRT